MEIRPGRVSYRNQVQFKGLKNNQGGHFSGGALLLVGGLGCSMAKVLVMSVSRVAHKCFILRVSSCFEFRVSVLV